MDINSNGVSITVSDKSTVDYEGVSLIGTGYNNLDNPSRTIGKLLNQNFLNLASKIKSFFVSLDTKADKTDTYTKTDVDTAIDDRINFLIGSAPQNLDTLYEIAQRLGEDDTKIAQMLDLIASKADKVSRDFGRFDFSSNCTSVSVGSKLPVFAAPDPHNTILSKDSSTITLKANKLYKLSADFGVALFNAPNAEFAFTFKTLAGVALPSNGYIVPRTFSADNRLRSARISTYAKFESDTDIGLYVIYNSGLTTLYSFCNFVFVEEVA